MLVLFVDGIWMFVRDLYTVLGSSEHLCRNLSRSAGFGPTFYFSAWMKTLLPSSGVDYDLNRLLICRTSSTILCLIL